MKKFSIAILLMISVLVGPISASAQPGNIYSWTDENGVKHFSDMAPAHVPAVDQEVIETRAPKGNDNSPSADALNVDGPPADALNNETMDDAASSSDSTAPEDELSYADQRRQDMAERRAEEQKKKAERERICLQASDQLARIEPSRRVFSTDENGNTTRLDDVERVKMVAESKREIAEYCD